MSRKEKVICSEFRESGFKAENEPEEGEIVDEYDLIVSSDEEFSMRQRIRELEAKNEEIEQIAVISRSYSNRLNTLPSRAAQVPSDVSSISSTEFVTPKKRKRGKSRERKKKHCHHQHQRQHHHVHQHTRHSQQQPQKLPQKLRSKKSHCKRRQKLFGKNNKKIHSDQYIHKEINAETISIDSLESSDSLSSCLSENDSYGKHYLTNCRKDILHDKETYITRDTLRLAVARNSNDSKIKAKKLCLKDKLLNKETVANYTVNGEVSDTSRINIKQENAENGYDDDDVQVIETDPYIQTIDEDSTDSMEEKELRLIALKSAVLKKHMVRKMRNAEAAYSPTDFDNMLSSSILQQDRNQDDLEIVDFEEDDDSQNACVIVSPEASPQLRMLDDKEESQQMVDCKPVDMDIANSDSEDTIIGSWTKEIEASQPSYAIMSQDFTNHFQYNFYMPDLHELPSKPPPPPGVDDYEHAPPPPPYHHFYNSEMQDMELDNEEIAEVQNLSTDNSNSYREIAETKELSNTKANICHNAESSDEEEEEALRALLLSKFQSPNNQKKSRKIPPSEEHKDVIKEFEINEHSDNNIKQTKPTEFILKEAVKRLKIHSQNDNSREAESFANMSNKNQENWSNKTMKSKENDTDSSILLETLRNRLLKCKDQNRAIQHEERVKEVGILKDERESFRSKFSKIEYAIENESMHSNNTEVANTIDISDITRRLQKIKEDVLKSTNKHLIKFEDNLIEDNKPLTENTYCIEENKTNLENKYKLHQPFHNNNDNVNDLPKNDGKNIIERDKTVEVNFDENTKQTTLKVTIKNDDQIKTEDHENILTNNEIILKENNANNVSKNTMLHSVTNTKSETATISTKQVLKHNNCVETKIENKPQIITQNKSVVKTTKTLAPTKFSTLRTTKIIKPNKVINTNVELKRIEFSASNDTPPANLSKTPQQDQSTASKNSVDNTRLITPDQVKQMCKVAPFIISLQNSSNESSEDEFAHYDSLYKPLHDYNDNASPLSLNLESPSLTPLRSNSPTELSSTTKNSTDLEKIVDQNLNTENLNASVTNKTKSNLLKQVDKTNKTPLAVRHLPAAAQSEYRKLVHRMMLLENKRKSTIVDENKQTNIGKKNAKNENDSLTLEDANKTDTETISKTNLIKTVLIRNANSNNKLSENQSATELAKVHKTNVLRSYENLFVKIGAGIVNNLDKSLKLVEEAKRAKISKLKLENRIKHLKAEMEILQSKHKQEQQKISHIYPNICTTNEVITSLKQKRSKIFKAAINLGKTLKGKDYRLNNDLKESIISKSKELASEIKIVNSLKIQDLANVESTQNSNTSSIKKMTDDKKNVVEDSTKKKLTNENSENIYIPDAAASDLLDKENKEYTEETKSNIPLLQTSTEVQFGGNTEFQKMEPNISNKNTIQSGDICSLEKCDENQHESGDSQSKQKTSLPSYISPLEHLRNLNSNMDPNGVICPYDLMGHCEDVACKYVHISSEANT